MRGPRRGQGNVITLMILVSVTIVLALLLYAYFTGAFTRQSGVEAMIRERSNYVTGLRINVESFSNSTNLTVTGGRYIYCGLFTITNNGGDTMAPTVTILPGAQGANGLFSPDPAIARFPLDYESSPIKRGLYAWLAIDYDHDGIIDMLAGPPDGPYTRVRDTLAPCMDIYKNDTLKKPANTLQSTSIYAKDIVADIPTNLRMLEVIKQAYPGANETFLIPSYRFTMDPGKTVSIYFYAESPVPLHRLSLIVLAPFNNIYIAAIYYPVWSESS